MKQINMEDLARYVHPEDAGLSRRAQLKLLAQRVLEDKEPTAYPGPWAVVSGPSLNEPWEVQNEDGRVATVYGSGDDGDATAIAIAGTPEALAALAYWRNCNLEESQDRNEFRQLMWDYSQRVQEIRIPPPDGPPFTEYKALVASFGEMMRSLYRSSVTGCWQMSDEWYKYFQKLLPRFEPKNDP